ncbi:MAG: GTPase Era [Bacteroidetes bacterium]|jgi:GTP-binding protein Era|nr:GTPase Era [Bacteroidota bacterium]MBT6685040.1 GTPase Era [Bacteroidota bacterium]MBT7143118.1 GTPase Era [Bacteroidota bacterium]MBT7491469.1 GTPase Era [Bacteroidota bacterium]
MGHKSGFVNIIGNPNVGKSTIMNALVGEKLSIITSKAQTTRHRIMGIVNGEDFQIVYSDTPGVLKPNYRLQESMMNSVKNALTDADIILYVSDVVENINKNKDFIEKLKNISIPIILLLNKIDKSTEEKTKELLSQWKTLLPNAQIVPISALEKFNIEKLFDMILELLPESPAYYPKGDLTDKTERFFVSEMIREQILLHYKKEIPYSVEVEVEEFKEDEKIIRIRAIIYAERQSQKGILIGHKGKMLKIIGTEARKQMEVFFNKKIFLETYVKINPDWRNKDTQLQKFGYY